jgi:hypothetical protein
LLIFFAARAMTVRTETSRDVVLPAVGGRNEARSGVSTRTRPTAGRSSSRAFLSGTEIRLLLPEARPDGDPLRPKEES